MHNRVVAFDPDQMERIILNLLSNAIKFTPKGGSIWVLTQDCGHYIKIKVKDTGIGISEEKQKIIFDRFQQTDTSLHRNEGSGIGLSLVKALVEKHSGKITLLSKIGEGSEFIIEIPSETVSDDVKSSCQIDSDDQRFVERIKVELADIYLKSPGHNSV